MRLKHLLPLIGSNILVTACGPMPGYRPPDDPPEAPDEDTTPSNMPRGGPADAPPEDDNAEGDSAGWDDEGGEAYSTPPEKRPPPPVRRQPQAEPQVAAPAPSTRTSPPVTPPPTAPSPVRVIEVDKDSAYIIDDARGLCFFRFREALAPIDCSRIAGQEGARPAAPSPTPSVSAPSATPAAPATPPTPGTFRQDELDRFQRAFNMIFCDRVAKSNTPPETRIREAGLDVARYEVIETYMADDDKRWWDVTDKARQSCTSGR